MEVVEAFKYHFTSFTQRIEDLVADMTFDMANDYIFLPNHFPIFFVFHVIYVCFVVRKHNIRIQWWKSIIITYLMAFTGRILIAFLLMRETPILGTPLYTPIYIIIWWFVNCSPEDFFYKILDNKFSAFIMQMIFNIIQIRETFHGTKFGVRYFPNSMATILLIGVILGSADAAVYCLSGLHKTRNFRGTAILRCLIFAGLRMFLVQNPDYTEQIFGTGNEGQAFVNITLLGFSCLLTILDDVLYGIYDPRMLGCVTASIVSKVFPFHGNSVNEPR